MRRVLWPLLVILLLPAPAHGAIEWQKAAKVNGVARFRDVSCSPMKFCLAVGGENGSVAASRVPGIWGGQIQLGPPTADLNAVSCPADACVAIGAARTGTDRAVYAYASAAPHDGTTWTRTRLDGAPVDGEVSCPTMTLCVAVTSDGVYASRDPFAPAPTWTQQAPVGAIASLDCPTEAFCAAVTPQGIAATRDAGATWESLYAAPVTRVSCPTETTCFATTAAAGRFLAWTNGIWAELAPPGLPPLAYLDCPAVAQCLAITDNGLDVLATRTPQTAAPWSGTATRRVVSQASGLACYAVDACAAVGRAGTVASGVPAAPTGWTVPSVVDRTQKDLEVQDLACPSEQLCLLLGRSPWWVYASANPAAGFTPAAHLPEDTSILSCASPAFCATTEGSRVLTTTSPATPAAWTSGRGGRSQLASIDCPTAKLCVSAGGGQDPSVSTDGGHTWTKRRTSRLARFRVVDCPTATLCVAAGGLGGRVGVLKNPARRSSKWQVTRLGAAKTPTGGFTSLSFSGLTCPAPRFCAALDWRGRIVTTTNPAGGKRAWKVKLLKGFSGFIGAGNVDVSCPTTTFCAAVDGTGAVATTRDGATTWTVAQVFAPSSKWTPGNVACASERVCVASYGKRIAALTP